MRLNGKILKMIEIMRMMLSGRNISGVMMIWIISRMQNWTTFATVILTPCLPAPIIETKKAVLARINVKIPLRFSMLVPALRKSEIPSIQVLDRTGLSSRSHELRCLEISYKCLIKSGFT